MLKSEELAGEIQMTTRAAERMKASLKKRGKGIGFQIKTKTSGCSDLAYSIEFIDETSPDYRQFELHGVKIFVDPKSLPLLSGVELDFFRDGLNEGFSFKNPNAKATCGCGKSFSA